MSTSTQPAQFGLRAKHTWRPCRISRSEKRPRSSGGTSTLRSSSAFTGSVSVVSLRRRASRPTCVSTGRPGRSKADRAHDVAGLAADARELHEVVELGRHLAVELVLERARHAEEVLRLRPVEARSANTSRSTSSGSAWARSAGVGYSANSAGVTLLTFSSVVCAERIVADEQLERVRRAPARTRPPGTPAVRRARTSSARALAPRGRAMSPNLLRGCVV